MQGCGVSTPSAAEVAAATCGLVGVVHMPKGMTFVKGALSMIVAAARLPAATPFAGNTFSVEGATPNVQVQVAPLTTSGGICFSLDRGEVRGS
jgi:hypothetical protein